MQTTDFYTGGNHKDVPQFKNIFTSWIMKFQTKSISKRESGFVSLIKNIIKLWKHRKILMLHVKKFGKSIMNFVTQLVLILEQENGGIGIQKSNLELFIEKALH